MTDRAQLDIEIACLKAENASLRQALRPFAAAAAGFDSFTINNPEEWFAYGGVRSHDGVEGAISVGDLRRARAELEKQ